jgi:bifunctional DNA-binding transcriptional regulator/antitoxin component of YhaV-PrlF toxin-antitoxin module
MFTEEYGMSLESKVSIARPKSKSLRATIPEGIVAFLELEKGDKLEWKMEIEDNERIAVVRKLKDG